MGGLAEVEIFSPLPVVMLGHKKVFHEHVCFLGGVLYI